MNTECDSDMANTMDTDSVEEKCVSPNSSSTCRERPDQVVNKSGKSELSNSSVGEKSTSNAVVQSEEINDTNIEVFTCTFCQKTYFTQGGYNKHAKICTAGNCKVTLIKDTLLQRCSNCQMFGTSAVCSACSRRKGGPVSDKCASVSDQCESVSDETSASVSDECESCGQKKMDCSKEEFLKRIIHNSEKNGQYPCRMCTRELVQRKETDGSLICSFCDKIVHRKNVVGHIIRIHILPKRIVPNCEVCGRIYNGCSADELLKNIIADVAANNVKHCRKCLGRVVRWSTNESKIICLVCEKSSTSLVHLEQHIVKMHLPSRYYPCKHCGKKYRTQDQMKGHSRIHKSDHKVKCNFCENYFRKVYLEYHIQQKHSDNPLKFVCSICGKELIGKQSFRYHMEKHENKIHTCSMCGKEFTTSKGVSAHVRRFHFRKYVKPVSKQERVPCDICKKYLFTAAGLKRHRILIHGSMSEKIAAKKWRCERCGIGFISRNLLKEHEYTHTGAKPFCCEICGKCFRRKCVLSLHKQSHADVKRYKCDTCGLTFSQGGSLTRHQVVHTGEKPFECGICGQRFTQKHYLKVHERKHSKQ